jgi:hypothetical protein
MPTGTEYEQKISTYGWDNLAPQTILLWNSDEIRYALERQHFRQGLIEKYRFCIEQGIPNYDIRAED